MLKTDKITCTLLYCMGADISSMQRRLSEEELSTFTSDKTMNLMRVLCKTRSAIMLRGKKSTQEESYPLQSYLCPKETFEWSVEYLRPSAGYLNEKDFTNQGLYKVFTACNQALYTLTESMFQSFEYLEPHKFVIRRFIVSKRKFTFAEFFNELQSINNAKLSMPWGVYTPLWKKLHQDNNQKFNTLLTSDLVFLPKVYYSTGRIYDTSKWISEDYSNYTEPLQRIMDSIKSSRNVSIIVDGDNVPPLLMMVTLKFMSAFKNVKAIKVVYNEEGLIRWENIRIDKVSYYRSRRYHSTKNNTDMIVGALLVEEQHKGASTTILVSSDSDYINVIDMIHSSDVIVLLPNQTNQTYINDLDERGIQTEQLKCLFSDEQVREMIEGDKRLSSMCMLPIG